MSSSSKIEWTEATWNPVVGCSIVSPGCTHCYAMKMAARIEAVGNAPHYDGTTKKVKGVAVWTGKLALAPGATLTAPLRRKKPTTYFVNSMGDLFHEICSDEWIDKVFAIMALCPQHTFQVLTKRAKRMSEYFNGPYRDRNGVCARIADVTWALAPDRKQLPEPPIFVEMPIGPRLSNGEPEFGWRRFMHPKRWPLSNVWLGVSCERQQEAEERIPYLLQTPAAVRFISAEPLLGPVDLDRLTLDPVRKVSISALRGWHGGADDAATKLDWVIVGGESGSKARPMHPQWARDLRDQCLLGKVPFFFKWGAWRLRPAVNGSEEWPAKWSEPRAPRYNETAHMERVGKKAAGRLLDGIEHNGMPRTSR